MANRNPYQPPEKAGKPPVRASAKAVSPSVSYALLGGLLATGIVGSLVLSSNPIARLEGGLIFGGPIGLLVGYLIGRRKQLRR